jgi:hypothetical protein
MTVIDFHNHVYPPEYIEALQMVDAGKLDSSAG